MAWFVTLPLELATGEAVAETPPTVSACDGTAKRIDTIAGRYLQYLLRTELWFLFG